MKLTLLGTGCPSVDHKRFGPSNLITTNKAKILVDCGSGITQRLHELKVSSANIDCGKTAIANELVIARNFFENLSIIKPNC